MVNDGLHMVYVIKSIVKFLKGKIHITDFCKYILHVLNYHITLSFYVIRWQVLMIRNGDPCSKINYSAPEVSRYIPDWLNEERNEFQFSVKIAFTSISTTVNIFIVCSKVHIITVGM